jgi:hypothetical protein
MFIVLVETLVSRRWLDETVSIAIASSRSAMHWSPFIRKNDKGCVAHYQTVEKASNHEGIHVSTFVRQALGCVEAIQPTYGQ